MKDKKLFCFPLKRYCIQFSFGMYSSFKKGSIKYNTFFSKCQRTIISVSILGTSSCHSVTYYFSYPCSFPTPWHHGQILYSLPYQIKAAEVA